MSSLPIRWLSRVISPFRFGAIARTRKGACTVISRSFPRSADVVAWPVQWRFAYRAMFQSVIQDTSAGTGKLCILGHLGLVFIWSCFVSCLLFLLFYVSLRNLCSGTCRKIRYSTIEEK